MTKTLICLKGNFEGLPVIQRAHALGLRLVVVDGDPYAPGFVGAEEVVCADHYSVDEVMNSHEFDEHDPEYAGPFDGVICCCGDMPHVAAALAKKFGLPGLTPEQAHLSVDKLAQKTALRAAGLPVPDFNGWERVVVKPPNLRGARGVKLIETGGVVEQYLDGPQLSTESIVQDGRVLFTAIGLRNYDRLAEFAPYIIEDGYDMPWGISWQAGSGWYPIETRVNDLLEKACRALGWDNLTVKGDWIIHDGGLVILELAARLSGGFFGTHGIPLVYQVGFVTSAIHLALGEQVPILHNDLMTGEYVSQRYVFPEPCDIGRRVVTVRSLNEIKDPIWMGAFFGQYNDAFKFSQELGSNSMWALGDGGPIAKMFPAKFISYAIHPGDIIAPVVSHGQRWGQATCTGATPEQARERAEQAVAAMKAAVVLE